MYLPTVASWLLPPVSEEQTLAGSRAQTVYYSRAF